MIEQRRPPATEPNTWAGEQHKWKLLRGVIGDKRIGQITNLDLDRYTDHRRRIDEVCDATIKKELDLWRIAFKKAKVYSHLSSDWPALRVKASDIGRALTRGELAAFCRFAFDNKHRNEYWSVALWCAIVLGNSGLRGGELKRLRRGMIDWVKGEVLISRRQSKSDGRGFRLPLNDEAKNALLRLEERYQQIIKKLNMAESPEHYLLPLNCSKLTQGSAKGGRGLDPTRPQQDYAGSFNNLAKAAGLPGFRPHDLRHTFITQMVEDGNFLSEIQTMVGQLSPRMVRHYTHIATERLRRMVTALDNRPLLPEVLTGRAMEDSADVTVQ